MSIRKKISKFVKEYQRDGAYIGRMINKIQKCRLPHGTM